MFAQEDIAVANKTSRANGAVGKNAITPRFVRQHVEMFYNKKDTMILDFGAGKQAVHTRAMLADGFLVTAWEFGDNVNPQFHNECALMQKYYIAFASNVLNVQSSVAMARATINQAAAVLYDNGKLFANYPASPRKSDITVKEMEQLLLEKFDFVTRVDGTVNAPLWMCKK